MRNRGPPPKLIQPAQLRALCLCTCLVHDVLVRALASVGAEYSRVAAPARHGCGIARAGPPSSCASRRPRGLGRARKREVTCLTAGTDSFVRPPVMGVLPLELSQAVTGGASCDQVVLGRALLTSWDLYEMPYGVLPSCLSSPYDEPTLRTANAPHAHGARPTEVIGCWPFWRSEWLRHEECCGRLWPDGAPTRLSRRWTSRTRRAAGSFTRRFCWRCVSYAQGWARMACASAKSPRAAPGTALTLGAGVRRG